jgi:hypothetical protein
VAAVTVYSAPDDGRKIRYNDDLCKLMAGEDTVRFIKAQRIQWLGNVERMDETAMPRRVLKGEPVRNEKNRKTKNKMDGGCDRRSKNNGN